MKLTNEEARNIVWGDHEDWDSISEEQEGTRRWSIDYSGVFWHKPTKKWYSLSWSVGATECQDERPFEHDNPLPIEVFPKKVTTTIYTTEKPTLYKTYGGRDF